MCNGAVELEGGAAPPPPTDTIGPPSAAAAAAAAAASARAAAVWCQSTVSVLAGSVEIFSSSHGQWVVADSVRPVAAPPGKAAKALGKVTVEYLLGGERRAKTVRANDRTMVRPCQQPSSSVSDGGQGRPTAQMDLSVAAAAGAGARGKKKKKKKRKREEPGGAAEQMSAKGAKVQK